MKTATQIEAYEQKIATAQTQVRQLAENVFSVPSSREGVKPHIITTYEGVANYCTCEAFQFNGWERYGHKCYHAQATERYIEAQKAVAAAEVIVAEAAKTPEDIQIEAYTKQGIDYSTAARIVNAKPAKSHGNAKVYESRGFSLLK